MSIRNLKVILAFDGVTCAAIFLLSLVAAVPIAALLGLPVLVVTVAGWICAASAALMFGVAAQAAPNAALTRLIAIGNLGWVAASFAVIAVYAAQLTGIGLVLIAAQAVAVLGFAILEWKGAAAQSLPATA